MSSIMRRRNGLMGFVLFGGSSLEVGVLDPSILKTERPPRHPRSIKMVIGPKAHGQRPCRLLPRQRVRSVILTCRRSRSAHSPAPRQMMERSGIAPAVEWCRD
jgi:hypothetical protein